MIGAIIKKVVGSKMGKGKMGGKSIIASKQKFGKSQKPDSALTASERFKYKKEEDEDEKQRKKAKIKSLLPKKPGPKSGTIAARAMEVHTKKKEAKKKKDEMTFNGGY